MEAILGLGSEWAAVRDALRNARRWDHMRDFAANSRYCRSHEAAVLNARAKKVLVCVDEVAVHTVAAELAGKGWDWWASDSWRRLLGHMR